MRIMVNGLPGKMASEVARGIFGLRRYELIPYSLTGSNLHTNPYLLEDLEINLIKPEEREEFIAKIQKPEISIDYTHPSAVNLNADFYCKHNLPFIMGTTGGDRTSLVQRVVQSDNLAIIDTALGVLPLFVRYALETVSNYYSGSLKGYTFQLTESHQKGKADVSAFARAIAGCAKVAGMDFDVKQIRSVREPEEQIARGISPEAVFGHASHDFSITSPEGSATFSVQLMIKGRRHYAEGTFLAMDFLSKKIASGEKGKVYSMNDVLTNS